MTNDSKERKETPVVTGVLDYFPLAIAAIARVSFKGNQKHNPGEPLHWSRHKSTDHVDCIGRHLAERDELNEETNELHAAHVAWRALAYLQIAEEKRLAEKKHLQNVSEAFENAMWAVPATTATPVKVYRQADKTKHQQPYFVKDGKVVLYELDGSLSASFFYPELDIFERAISNGTLVEVSP